MLYGGFWEDGLYLSRQEKGGLLRVEVMWFQHFQIWITSRYYVEEYCIDTLQ